MVVKTRQRPMPLVVMMPLVVTPRPRPIPLVATRMPLRKPLTMLLLRRRQSTRTSKLQRSFVDLQGRVFPA